jgi:hypothetical protein
MSVVQEQGTSYGHWELQTLIKTMVNAKHFSIYETPFSWKEKNVVVSYQAISAICFNYAVLYICSSFS